METSSALLAFVKEMHRPAVGSPPQGLVTWSFDILFNLRLKKTAEQTIGTPMLSDAIVLIITSQ